MTLLEGILKDNIFVDFGSEIRYGSDQVCLAYPKCFATVSIQLMATPLLEEIADRIRIADGHRPMYPMDEYTGETCDQDGWYDFYIGLNDLSPEKIDTCIEFMVVNSEADDNGARYTIGLGRDEQAAMYARLDEQCRGYLGKGCEELLEEARKEMMDG